MKRDDLYIIQMAVTGDIKIGRSKHVDKRCRQLQCGAPHQLKVILRVAGMGYREKHLHRYLREFRNRGQRGEWFREEAIGSLPLEIYELFPVEYLENSDWWKK